MIWFLGIFLVLLGLFVMISAFFQRRETFPERMPNFQDKGNLEKKYGGVVLIGPIPIVFGETRLAVVALVLSIILMLLSVALIFGWLI
ncbi:MAG: TIGR00304 family protein [Archaeoglobaceae archaeon]|nr:TIGR00304 family protein [Archaeoglobales archaeon]MDI9642312.1 TIGR00304 family protein [Archaeoglobales archaeon]